MDKNRNSQTEGSACALGLKPDSQPSTQFNVVFKRMMQALGTHKAVDVARALEITQQSISSAKAKQKIPAEWYVVFFEKFNISIDWLLTGKSRMRLDQPLNQINASQSALPDLDKDEHTADETNADCKLITIPRVKAYSPEHSSFETHNKPATSYAFCSNWIRGLGNSQSMVLMRVTGDSMKPNISHNDMVLIDINNTEVRAGCVYAVAVENLIYLKKVDSTPGKLILTSFNPAYPPIYINTQGETPGVKILGKVLWLAREMLNQ